MRGKPHIASGKLLQADFASKLKQKRKMVRYSPIRL
jgi:hypothetical protein